MFRGGEDAGADDDVRDAIGEDERALAVRRGGLRVAVGVASAVRGSDAERR